MAMARLIAAYLAAVLATMVVASFVHTRFVVEGLRGIGADIPPHVALETARGDFVGLAPSLGPVIAIALLLGFVIAGIARRFIRLPRPAAFALAGAAALATALWLMKLSYEITPIASARSWAGFLSLCAAGALGGLVFALLLRKPRPAA
jgi:peptidoglycan/LPS O-acetylase OafA/YrhL